MAHRIVDEPLDDEGREALDMSHEEVQRRRLRGAVWAGDYRPVMVDCSVAKR